MSALEIMQACLNYFKDNAKQPDNRAKAKDYLDDIEGIINGEKVLLSNDDFSEIHKFVISIYTDILDKGEVTKGKWTSQHWKKVLENIKKYSWDKIETYEVSKMKKSKKYIMLPLSGSRRDC